MAASLYNSTVRAEDSVKYLLVEMTFVFQQSRIGVSVTIQFLRLKSLGLLLLLK